MPHIYGKIYAEIQSAGLLNHRFVVLIDLRRDSDTLRSFVVELCTLRAYLYDIVDSPVHLELFITSSPLGIYEVLELTPVVLNKDIAEYNKKILSMAKLIKADLVVTEDVEVKDFFNIDKSNFLVENYKRAKKSVEIFVRGHEVPWSFSEPMWHMPWTVFYSMGDEFGKEAYRIYETKFIEIGLNGETVEIIRSLLLNRVANICYTRDKLLFYVQQRRYAKRQGRERQDFSFEASYYLCHYYLLLWGGVDQLSRILNNALNLGVSWFSEISLARDDFVSKIVAVDKNVGNLYRDDDFVRWIKQLRINRHHTAHQGSIILSPIVETPKSEPSDEELQKEARANPMWDMMKRTLSEEMFDWYNASLKQSIRISKYKVLIDDAMVIQDGKEKYIFRPLANIEWDFNNFRLITLNTLELLYEFLKNRKKNI